MITLAKNLRNKKGKGLICANVPALSEEKERGGKKGNDINKIKILVLL
jgi:hypothetical protein